MAPPNLQVTPESARPLGQLQVTIASNKLSAVGLYREELKKTLNVWQEVQANNPDDKNFKSGVAKLQAVLNGFDKAALPFQERSALRNTVLLGIQNDTKISPSATSVKCETIQKELLGDLRQIGRLIETSRTEIKNLEASLDPRQKEAVHLAGIRQNDPFRSGRETAMVVGEAARTVLGFVGAQGAILSAGTTLLNNFALKATQDIHGQEVSSSSTALAGVTAALSLIPGAKALGLAATNAEKAKKVLTSSEAVTEVLAGGKLSEIAARSAEAFIPTGYLSRINAFKNLFEQLDHAKIASGTAARGMATLMKFGGFGEEAVFGAVNAAKELAKDGVLTPENAKRLSETLSTLKRTTSTIGESSKAIGVAVETTLESTLKGLRIETYWNHDWSKLCAAFTDKLLSKREFLYYAESAIEHLKEPIELLAKTSTSPEVRKKIAKELLEQFGDVTAKLKI